MRHKVPVLGRWQEPLWQSESQEAEEVEDLTTGRLREALLEAVACPPAVGVDAFLIHARTRFSGEILEEPRIYIVKPFNNHYGRRGHNQPRRPTFVFVLSVADQSRVAASSRPAMTSALPRSAAQPKTSRPRP